MAQLVEALLYKPEGRGFVSLWCHNLSGRTMALGLTQPLTEMGGRCVGLTTLPPSCADCLEIWEPHPPGIFRACNGVAFTSPYMHLRHEQEKLNILQLRIFCVNCPSEVKIGTKGLTVNTLRHHCNRYKEPYSEHTAPPLQSVQRALQ